MGKGFWISLVAILVIMIGGFAIFGGNGDEVENQVDNPHEITAEDTTLGAEDAPITVIEYSDFQCPACQAAEPGIQEMLAEYEDDVRFVYRHFPLTQIHPQAYDAARAAEAAGQQDMFWEMHDLLFERQQDWSGDASARSLFEDYAEELELDMQQYDSDFADASSDVDRDVNIGQQLGVSSTPTFYVNGEQIDNPGSIEGWRTVIDEALEGSES